MFTPDEGDSASYTGEITIGNEFARVLLDVIPADSGDMLRVYSVRTGWVRYLSAEMVERVSRLPLTDYLEALFTPFGPEPDLAFSPETN